MSNSYAGDGIFSQHLTFIKDSYILLYNIISRCVELIYRIKNINVKTRFDQIHNLFHKILSINIILKSIKGHNSVEKFGKIMCISHNMDHIYQLINKLLSKSIHYF